MRNQSLIRDTQIKAETVYRDLELKGMSEEAVLAKYPQLTREDLAGIKDTVIHDLQSIDRDEVTGRKILAKAELVDAGYYKGRCRNATIARWNARENCFYHWREKFAAIFIETIMYPTDEEPWFDVFNPVEALSDCAFEIPFEKGAQFEGRREDLNRFAEEMWTKERK